MYTSEKIYTLKKMVLKINQPTLNKNTQNLRKFSGFRSGIAEDSVVGYDFASLGNQFPCDASSHPRRTEFTV